MVAVVTVQCTGTLQMTGWPFVAFSSWGVFARRCATTGAEPGYRLSVNPSSCVSPTVASGRIFMLFLLALFTLGKLALSFFPASYLAVTCPVSWCCLWNTEN